MDFNKEISKYVFKGVSFGSERGIITTLKNTLNGLGIYNDFAFDTSERFYKIDFNHIVEGWGVTILRPEQLDAVKILTPEEFICKLVDNPIQLDWYNNLHIGDTVKIGYCDPNNNNYYFGFDTNLVRANYGNEYIIDNIVNVDKVLTEYPLWYNDDPRAYYIKELDHYLPSSVFIPQFIPSTPIEKIILQSLPISDFSFLK